MVCEDEFWHPSGRGSFEFPVGCKYYLITSADYDCAYAAR
jgi:hypothetical protein